MTATWQINIHPVPNPEPDPAGYLVARFTAKADDCYATGNISRGRDGLSIARIDYTTPDSGGLKTRMVRDLQFNEILAHARASVEVATAGMPVAQAEPEAAEPCCSCAGHAKPSKHGGRAPLSDDHLRSVAEAYLAATAPGAGGAVIAGLGEQFGRPAATVQHWIKRARRDGWLGPGVKGRSGAEPGPRLIAERAAARA
jgi:hypothetical protein